MMTFYIKIFKDVFQQMFVYKWPLFSPINNLLNNSLYLSFLLLSYPFVIFHFSSSIKAIM